MSYLCNSIFKINHHSATVHILCKRSEFCMRGALIVVVLHILDGIEHRNSSKGEPLCTLVRLCGPCLD